MINNPFYPKISQTEPPKSQLSDFEIQCELGHGSFGIVYKVKRKTDGKIYALKKVYLNQLKEKERQNSLNEIRILASINNKNIIQYKGSFYDNINNSLCLVMEYAENGDLEKKITTRQKKNLYFQEYEILNMIIQIIKGLKSLHDYKIMHRDIKSANIFLFNDNIVKIGDLNVSKILKNNLHNTQTGTPYYASPEIWENKSYDFKSDIWSLGCLIYEICALKAPFRGNSMKIVYDKVIKGIYEPIPKMYSRALGGIVYICLQTNPINRPTCEQLLNIINNQYHLFNLLGKKIKVFSNDEEIENKKDFGNENNNDNCNLNNNNNDIDIGENEGKVINNDNNKNNENNNSTNDINNNSIETLPKILTKNNNNSPSRKKTDFEIFIEKQLHEKPKLKNQIILDKIYGFNNNNYLKNINKYKKEGEKIAFNKKFDIIKYQSKGLELVSENFSLKNIKLLSEKYRDLNNQINNRFKVKKTKWERLADSLEKRAPKSFLEKLRNLGKKNVKINIDEN